MVSKRFKKYRGGNRDKLRQALDIERVGRAENFATRFHRSAIVAAKPRRRGRITSPCNPYTGCIVQDFDKFYGIVVPLTRNDKLKIVRKAMLVQVTKLGGLYYGGSIGYVFPKTPEVAQFIRALSVKWG